MNDHLSAFLKVLDPLDNGTGGGSASAIAGAMAAALVAMVARLSLGKKNMQPDAFYLKIDSEARHLALELMKGSNADSRAFEQVQTTFKLPKETVEQKNERKAAQERAWILAATVPMENARNCRQVIKLRQELLPCFNPHAASDLECAGLLAKAGLLGCLANVEINVSGIKDEKIIQQLKNESDVLREAS